MLAIFPLCIAVVQLYVGGAETLAGMQHHRKFLRDLQRELNTEKCKFFVSVQGLFDDVTFQESGQLLRDPTSKQDQEEQLKAMLIIPEVVNTVIESVQALNFELDELRQDLLALVLDEKTRKKLKQEKVTKLL